MPDHKSDIISSRDPNTAAKPINNDFDIGSELHGFGLQGIRTTDDELRKLVEELGLGGDDAADMVRSLGGDDDSKPDMVRSFPKTKSEGRSAQSVEKENTKLGK